MRAFLLSAFTLTFFTMIYAAPAHNNAGDCKTVGNCVDESLSPELAARGETLFYGLSNGFLYPNNAEPGIAQIVTEVAYAPATVTHVVVTTVQHSSPTSGSHIGFLDGLLSGPRPVSPKPASSNHNSLSNGLPGSDLEQLLPDVEQLLNPNENQVKVDLS